MLVNKIRQKPYSVVLFDEIEKAHSSVYDVFLQIMDEGKIHDKLGREGDFSNAIIIFTSNKCDAGFGIASSYLIENGAVVCFWAKVWFEKSNKKANAEIINPVRFEMDKNE